MDTTASAIIGAVLTGVFGLIAYFYKSRQGNYILVSREADTPQITISDRVRQNLEMSYKDRPITNLVLNTLSISNKGNETIDNVQLKIYIKPKTGIIKFLEVEEDDPQEQTVIVQDADGFTLSRPYLNKIKAIPTERIELAIFSNTKLNFEVESGGRGWYTKFGEKRKQIDPYLLLGLAVGIFISISVMFTIYVQQAPISDSYILILTAIIVFAGTYFGFFILGKKYG